MRTFLGVLVGLLLFATPASANLSLQRGEHAIYHYAQKMEPQSITLQECRHRGRNSVECFVTEAGIADLVEDNGEFPLITAESYETATLKHGKIHVTSTLWG